MYGYATNLLRMENFSKFSTPIGPKQYVETGKSVLGVPVETHRGNN